MLRLPPAALGASRSATMLQRFGNFLLGICLGAIAAVGLQLAFPFLGATQPTLAVAMQPPSPQLGDTIAVFVTAASPPAIAVDGATYPAFPLSANRWRAFVPTTPLDRPGTRTLQVTADGLSQQFALTVRSRTFPTQRLWFDEKTAGLEATDLELKRVAEFKRLMTPQKFWQGPLLRPNDGEVTSGYGIRRYYNGVFAKDYYHRGVDYAGGVGSPVRAPAAGYVRLVGTVKQGFRVHGNTIGIDHGQGVTSIFLHLSRIDVKEGDFVQAGQRIGAVGGTGAATGPHLHWGLYVNGLSVDPTPWRTVGFE